MICNDCYAELRKLVQAGVMTESQWQAAAQHLRGTRGTSLPIEQIPTREVKKDFNPITVLYYLGALMILSAFGWFLGRQWDSLGPWGIFAVSSLYAGLFLFLGRFLRDENFPTASGLLYTCAVGMVPLMTYALQAGCGVWPKGVPPGGYNGYYLWINGSWIIIEMATVAVGLFALRKVKFSFLVMPMAIALWFFSMDIAEIILSTNHLTWESRSWVSVATGALYLIVGRVVEKHSDGVDYAFWVYFAGLLAFWGGLTSLPSHGEFSRFIYLLINLGLLATSLRLGRKTFAVFGGMGIWAYIGHLAYTVFKDSAAFPLVLALVGLMVILSAVLFQKSYERLKGWVSA